MDLSRYDLYCTETIKEKLLVEHDVSFEEVEEAFFNSSEPYPIDDREDHKTNPPTQWFVADTFEGRLLKVCFILKKRDKRVEIKSAYDADETIIVQYLLKGGKIAW